MSEEKILNKYIELINKGYCCACNELNCIDNFPQKKIANAISNLQQEKQQLKENNMSMQEEMARTWEKADLYKEVIEEAREYIEKSSLEVNTKEFGNLTVCNSDDLLQILDKARENK